MRIEDTDEQRSSQEATDAILKSMEWLGLHWDEGSGMAIHAALTHETSYRYDRPVSLGPQVIRLRPAPHCRTRILSYSLRVTPAEHFLNWQQDPQSNYLARLVIPEKTGEFKVVVDLVAEMAVHNPFDFFLEPEAEHVPFTYEPGLAKDLAPYLETETPGPRLRAWLDSVPRERERTIDFLVALNQRLQREIGYVVRMEPGLRASQLPVFIEKSDLYT